LKTKLNTVVGTDIRVTEGGVSNTTAADEDMEDSKYATTPSDNSNESDSGSGDGDALSYFEKLANDDD